MCSFNAVLSTRSGLAASCFRNRVPQDLTRFFTTRALFSNRSVASRICGAGRCGVWCGSRFVGSHRVLASGCNSAGSRVRCLSFSAGEVEAADSMERRCAIITGVARPRGIGRHLMNGFIGQGYNVVGVDIEKPKQEEDDRIRSENFHFVQADVGVPTEAERIVQETLQRFGDKIHVLINNAAKLPHSGASDPVKEFTDTIAVNLNGAYYLSQATLPHMPAGSSSIIHMSSTRAHQSEPDTAGYSASKAGLCGLTHSQAITLAGKVRVNAVLPGWINTDEGGEAALRPEDHAWHPVGRVGVPQDVVEMCLFLSDNRRAGFLTGQEFVVDGGVSKMMVYPG